MMGAAHTAATRAILAFGDTLERKDEEERDGNRGEGIPLQRVGLVLLDAEVRPRPVAKQAVAVVGMLLDDHGLKGEARFGRVGRALEGLAHRAFVGLARRGGM